MNINLKISLNRYHLGGDKPHITVNTDLCRQCVQRSCIYVCPVDNYRLVKGELEFSCDACVECGACRITCEPGAVEWTYPRGGFGICFRYG